MLREKFFMRVIDLLKLEFVVSSSTTHPQFIQLNRIMKSGEKKEKRSA